MRKLRLNRFSNRVFPVKTLFNYTFHNRNIPYISEQAIHLHNILTNKTDQRQSPFHFIKRTIALLFDRSTNAANTVAQKAIIASRNDSCMSPSLVNIISLYLAVYVSEYSLSSFHLIGFSCIYLLISS